MTEIEERINIFLSQKAESEDVELFHVEYRPKADPPLLRLYIDRPGGITHGDCERMSKQASSLLDTEELIPHQYVLEVSSPGIERPLFKESDYVRFQGSEIRLETLEKLDGRRRFRGILESFSEGFVNLSDEGTTYRIPFHQISQAKLVHRFD